ncbi:DNA cytosine methyltransferase [Candidatus Pacearchaeota archaeon]|nr:DNA cytosine methyltransferase [Candidatus Pacearchaeota archaeon]
MMPKGLDLFSGERTALAAFGDWEIDYVEIRDGVDIRDFKPKRIYDFIWASPPCNEYTIIHPNNRFKVPDRFLWYEALRVIDRGKKKRTTPWVIENVAGAQYWFGRPRIRCYPYFFWGWFPHPKLPSMLPGKDCQNEQTVGKRSRIPYEISLAFYKAIDNHIEQP